MRWGACVAVWGQWSQRVNGVIATMGYEVAHGTYSVLPTGQDYGPDTTTYSCFTYCTIDRAPRLTTRVNHG
eukprot:COSAG01_NODE_20619_length_944_cov_14.907692_2_plen_71_part_00